ATVDPNPSTGLLTPNLTTLLKCVPAGTTWGSTVVFQWNGANAQRYAVHVSDNRNFTGYAFSPNINGGTGTFKTYGGGGWTDGYTSTPLTLNGRLNLQPGKTYFWRVWASNGPDYITYDQQFYTGYPTTLYMTVCSGSGTVATPLLIQPKPSTNGVPTPNINNPVDFIWTPVVGGTAYILAVSDNQTNLESLQGFWRATISPTACSTTCHKNWNDTAWLSWGKIPVKDLILNPGQTYYWFVWACNINGGCTLEGHTATSSFTMSGVNQQPATNLNVAVGASDTTFSWSPANDGASGLTINHYQVLLKQGSLGNNFSVGSYWKKNVGKIECLAGICNTKLSSTTWSWVNATTGTVITNPAIPPNPLFKGSWYWIVIACKTAAC
ncbi:MAG: hypothetical protein Q7T74_04835, partial [Candidatus Saccharibacteria bacterium]|nr:hypothetical protein [Candidatus Saccharibacteria bacterium]